MKKLFVIFLICIAFTLSISVCAVASPVFDLDVSGFNGNTNQTDESIVTGILPSSTLVKGTPTLGTINSLNGITPYLTFATGSTVGINNWLKVKDSTLLNMSEMTIETWARTDFGIIDWSRMFGISAGTDASISMEVMLATNKIYFKVMKNGAIEITKNYDISAYNNKWTHYVFTRKCVNDTWDYSTYINGVKIGDLSAVGVSKTRKDETGSNFYIGSSGVSKTGYTGAISDFKVYNSILDASTILANYNNEVVNYAELSTTMNLLQVLPSNTSIIDVETGALEVTFDNYIKSSTINGISFTKIDGTEVKGGAYVTTQGNTSKKAAIIFGRLERNTQYKLSISNELKSINNISAANIEMIYTTNDGYLINEDFSSATDYVVGESPPTGKGISYMSAGVSGVTSDIKVMQTADGDKYLSIIPSVIAKDHYIKKDLTVAVTDGVLVAETKVRATSIIPERANGNATRSLGRILGGSQTYDLGSMASGVPKAGTVSFNANTFDSNGFYSIKTVMKKNANGYYYAEITNPNDPSWTMTAVTRDDAKCATITGLMVAHIYPTTSDHLSDRSEISALRMYMSKAPKVLYCDNQIEPDQDLLKIVFDRDLRFDLVTTGSIVIKEGNSPVISSIDHIDVENRSIYLKLGQYLKYNTDYTVNFSGIKSLDNLAMASTVTTFRTRQYGLISSDITFINQAGNTVTKLEGATEITARANLINNFGIGKACVMVGLLCDDKGRVIKAQSHEVIVNTTDNIEVTLSNLEIRAGYSLAVFLWEIGDLSSNIIMPEKKQINY